jgi:hypothetical protein
MYYKRLAVLMGTDARMLMYRCAFGRPRTLLLVCNHAKNLLQLRTNSYQKCPVRSEHDCDGAVRVLRRENRRRNQLGVIVRSLIRKIIIGTASVIALGIAGDVASRALDYAADANTATAANMPAPAENSKNSLSGDALRRDDIRWARLQLRNRGLYSGSLDGILGPETRRAVSQFQAMSGLGRTASLDAQTWEALTGNPTIGEGSNMPSRSESSTASHLGR